MSAAPSSNSTVTALRLPRRSNARINPTSRRSQHSDECVYYAGPENRLVAEAVGRLIAKPSDPVTHRLCPLTLIGGPACGKSLLAQGVEAAWTTARGVDAVLATTGVDLRRQLEHAFARERQVTGAVASLEDRLAGARLLVVENLEGVADSAPTVELLSGVVDRLIGSGGALLVTAGRPLGEIAGLTTRLVGRLVGGLTLTVSAPGEEARAALLEASLHAEGARIERSAKNALAAWLPADARRVLAVARELVDRFGVRTPITAQDAERYIAEISRDLATTPLAEIAGIVGRYYRMPLRTLRSSSRKQPVVLARAVTIYLARQLTPLSYGEIGSYLGGRDHTTVMHSYNRIEQRMPRERALRSAIGELLGKLGRADLAQAAALQEDGGGL